MDEIACVAYEAAVDCDLATENIQLRLRDPQQLGVKEGGKY